MPLLFLGLLVSVSAISQAGPVQRGSIGRGIVGRGPVAVHGGTFNRGFRTGNGIHRNFADRRFRNRAVVVGWPFYGYPWYPYDDLNYSYLQPDPQPDYQYWDNSSAYVQPQPERTNYAAPQNPVLIVINNGYSRPTGFNAPTDPRGLTDPGGDRGYVNTGYSANTGLGQQRTVVQDPPNEHTATPSMTPVDPVVPQATPVPQQTPQTSVHTGTGPFSKFVVLSWLKDKGKDVIAVKNVETNDVQRITFQPNIDHFRIVEIHPNPDLRQFEAIISNGSDQGPVRFQF